MKASELPHFAPSNRLSYVMQYELLGRMALRVQRWNDARKLGAFRPSADDPLTPPLRCVTRVKELMARHYLEGRYAAGVRPVAWVTSGAPTEVLKALGFFLIYPENHAALCGARHAAEGLCIAAENAGYSRDLCSYGRTDMGTVLTGKTPVGRLPRPDLLLCCTNICQTVLYWYRNLADYFRVPLVVIDTPFLYHEAEPHQVAYVKRQLEEMVEVAERVSHRGLSAERFAEVVRCSRRATELWLAILDLSRNRPAPMTAFDGFTHMAPIVELRGEAVTVEYYEIMLAELEERVRRGIGAVRNERLRVLWDNLPIWFQMGRLSKMLARRGVNVVASTYTYAWGELAPMIDESKGLESMANVYLHPILNRSAGHKLRAMQRMVKDFHIDGAILHSDRSCKPYSLGQMDQRERLLSEAGVPALLLEADHSDPRSYADQQAEARLEAFIETMEAAA